MSDDSKCRISEGVMFIRHSNDNHSPSSTPLLLFTAGHGSNSSSSSSSSPSAASLSSARRLYWSTRCGADGVEWKIESVQLSSLTHITVGSGGSRASPFSSLSSSVADQNCFTLLCGASGLALHLECGSSVLLRSFLAQLLCSLRSEFVSVQYSGPSLQAEYAEPEADRPDAIHFVLAHLFQPAMDRFNYAAQGAGGSGRRIDSEAIGGGGGVGAGRPSSPSPPAGGLWLHVRTGEYASTNLDGSEEWQPTRLYWAQREEERKRIEREEAEEERMKEAAKVAARAFDAAQGRNNKNSLTQTLNNTSEPGGADSSSSSSSSSSANNAATGAVALSTKGKALLRISASNLHPAPSASASSLSSSSSNQYSNMLVVFSQESSSSQLFTFIGHSEIVARDAAPKFSTLFPLSYAPHAHRSVLVHVYDGARAAAIISSPAFGVGGAGGGGGLGSLADDLLASFVLDMDDLASAPSGTQLVYAPQQVSEKCVLRFAKARGASTGSAAPQPRINVSFTLPCEENNRAGSVLVSPESQSSSSSSSNSQPQAGGIQGALSPLANNKVAPTPSAAAVAAAAAADESAVRAQLLHVLSNGSLFTRFHLMRNDANQFKYFDPADPHTHFVPPLIASNVLRQEQQDEEEAAYYAQMRGRQAKNHAKNKSRMEAINFFVDMNARRMFWSDTVHRSSDEANSVRLVNLLALVVGKETLSFRANNDAAETAAANCFSIVALYDFPLRGGAEESMLLPVCLDLACFAPRVREQWMSGLVSLYSQVCPGGTLPVLSSAPDLDALQAAHGPLALAHLHRRKELAAAILAAKAAAAARVLYPLQAPPVGAHEFPELVDVQFTARGTATEFLAGEKENPDLPPEPEEECEVGSPRYNQEQAAAAAKQRQQAASSSSSYPPHSSAASSSSVAASSSSSSSSSISAAPVFPPSVPFVAPPSSTLLTLSSYQFPSCYFSPLSLSCSLSLHLYLSCTNLFGLDASRRSDMVLAVFSGSAFDQNKPASPAGLAFSPAAAFKYTLLDNSESVLGDLAPKWSKPFEYTLNARPSVAEQHMRLNLYDAAGEGVTAKDQLGLVWVDLRELLRPVLSPSGLLTKASSVHRLSYPLVHPTNPQLHAELARKKSTMQLELRVYPKGQAPAVAPAPVAAAPAQPAAASQSHPHPHAQAHPPVQAQAQPHAQAHLHTPAQAANEGQVAQAAAPGNNNHTHTSGIINPNVAVAQPSSSSSSQKQPSPSPSPSPVLSASGSEIYTPTSAQMTSLGLPSLLSRLSSPSFAQSFDRSLFPASSGSVPLLLSVSHLGSLAPSGGGGKDRQAVVALYERQDSSGDNLVAPFLFRALSNPARYIVTSRGGEVSAELSLALRVGSKQLLLLALFFTDQLPPSSAPPRPDTALAVCVCSADEVALQAGGVRLMLGNTVNAQLDKKLRELQAVVHVQAKRMGENATIQHAHAPAAASSSASSSSSSSSSVPAVSPSSLSALTALQSSMRLGSFFKMYDYDDAAGYVFDPFILFADEVLMDDAADASEAFFALFWCPSSAAPPNGGLSTPATQQLQQVEGNVLPIFSISDLHLGMGAHEAFSVGKDNTKHDGLYLVIEGEIEPEQQGGEPQKMQMVMEAYSQQARDLWVEGLVATAKTYGQIINVHR